MLDSTRWHGHSFQSDIWAFGIIIFILLFGKPPFDSEDPKQTYQKIRMNSYSFPQDVEVQQQAKDFIKDILISNPMERLSLEEIINHKYINGPEHIPPYLPIEHLTEPPTEEYIHAH